nr:hypothetical protein 21 [bacterium]
MRETFISHAKSMSRDPGLKGYVIVSWDINGDEDVAWRIEDDSPIPENLLPAYIEHVLIRSLCKKENS